MRGQPREARVYELMTILSPDVPEEEIGGQIERIAGFVTDAGGTVQDTRRDSPWGRRRLAYPIRHDGRDLRDGFYTLFHIELEPHRIDDLERDLKLDDLLIRHLVTSYVPQPIDPRAVEDAEVAAEDAAAEAYSAAQAEAARLAAPVASNGDLSAPVESVVVPVEAADEASVSPVDEAISSDVAEIDATEPAVEVPLSTGADPASDLEASAEPDAPESGATAVGIDGTSDDAANEQEGESATPVDVDEPTTEEA